MHLSRLTLSWEDGIHIVSSYVVLLLVTWSSCCYLNVNYFCINLIKILIYLAQVTYNQVATAISNFSPGKSVLSKFKPY